MHSSTSSSDRALRRFRADDWTELGPDSITHVPAGRWGLAWLLAVIVVTVTLVGVELGYRRGGIRGSVVDDKDLWAYHRSRVHGPPGRVVVLLGSSQMQVGFSTEWFRRHGPDRRIVQLAVDGMHPFATLRDLANDRRFRGVVIIDASVWGLSRGARESQEEYVRHYHHTSSLDRQLNRAASAWLEERLAMRAPGIDPLNVLRTRRLPDPFYVVMRADRSQDADYTMLDIDKHHADRIRQTREAHDRPPIPPQRWLDEAMAVEPLVERIEGRGGRVAFVNFPSTDESWEIFNSSYPRALYWDRFAARTRAITLHFRDVPELLALRCPDTVHLDQRDTPRFTEVVIRELSRLGLFDKSGNGHVADVSPSDTVMPRSRLGTR